MTPPQEDELALYKNIVNNLLSTIQALEILYEKRQITLKEAVDMLTWQRQIAEALLRKD